MEDGKIIYLISILTPSSLSQALVEGVSRKWTRASIQLERIGYFTVDSKAMQDGKLV